MKEKYWLINIYRSFNPPWGVTQIQKFKRQLEMIKAAIAPVKDAKVINMGDFCRDMLCVHIIFKSKSKLMHKSCIGNPVAIWKQATLKEDNMNGSTCRLSLSKSKWNTFSLQIINNRVNDYTNKWQSKSLMTNPFNIKITWKTNCFFFNVNNFTMKNKKL